MAELTIAQLTELLAANVDNADLLPIWDDTASETKKITISNFRTAVGVSNWSESFSSTTQATSQWIPNNVATNVNAAIVPKGNGAIVAAIPDGTSVGGNARGQYAVDLQILRNNANQVASGRGSVIGGGERNRLDASNLWFSELCVIAGGLNNYIAGNQTATISGGNTNYSAGNHNVISGGLSNTINTSNFGQSVISGGGSNTITKEYAVISGGISNSISGTGTYSAIVGGATNTASGSLSFVGGGQSNTSSGSWSKVGGGKSNTAGGYFNVIGGGFTNSGTANAAVTTQSTTTTSGTTAATLSGANANIKVGQLITGTGIADDTYVAAISGTSLTLSKNASGSGTNTLSFFTPHGVVVGGGNNQATGSYSFIGGGGDAGTAANRNVASGDWSVVVGGYLNTAAGLGSFVGGGIYNRANGLRSVIVGGGFSSTNSNRTESSYSFIGSGYNNLIASSGANDYGAVIAGGVNNGISGGTAAFIGGGGENQISKPEVNSGSWCTIVGGYRNKITGPYSNQGFLGGGAYNTLGNGYSMTIVGGGNNTTNGSGSFIGGGNQNTIGSYPSDAALTGGRSNTISANGNYGHIGGGQSNTASATHTTVSGGQSNTASGSYSSVIGGLSANSNLYGQSAHASGQFSAQGDAQAHELIWRREITGTAQTELFLDGASIAAILPSTNSVWHGIIDITSICTVAGSGTTVLGDVAATSYKATIKRLNTNTALVGSVQEIGTLNSDVSMAAVAFTIDANDTNESLRIQFTPPPTAAADTVIRVVATFRGTQIKY